MDPKIKKVSKSAEKSRGRDNIITKNTKKGVKASKSVENFNKANKEKQIGAKVDKKPAGLTPEEKKQKWIKSLPQQIRHLHHLPCIKDTSLTDKQKLDYWKKYNIETKDKEWTYPKTEAEKQFALDIIIDHLYNNSLFRNENHLQLAGKSKGKGKVYPTSPRRGGGFFALCNNQRPAQR